MKIRRPLVALGPLVAALLVAAPALAQKPAASAKAAAKPAPKAPAAPAKPAAKPAPSPAAKPDAKAPKAPPPAPKPAAEATKPPTDAAPASAPTTVAPESAADAPKPETAPAAAAAPASASSTSEAGGGSASAPAAAPVTPVAAPATDSPSAPATPAATPPTPAPAAQPAPEAPSTGPTLTLGAGGASVGDGASPKKDEAKKSEPEAAKKEPVSTPIDGSTFFFQTGVSPNVFSPGMVQSPDVTVDSFALLQPRWSFSKEWQLRGRVAFNYEWTDNVNSGTTRKNEPRFLDSTVSLAYRGIPTFGGVKAVVSALATLPTSPESQARTLYVSPGISVALARPVEHVLGGELALSLAVTYAHPLYHYTTAGLENPPPYARQCYTGAGASCTEQVSGGANTSDSIAALASVGGEWGKWSPSLFMLLNNGWAYTFQDLNGVARMSDRTSFRQSTFFGAALDYQFNSWISGEVGYQMFRSILDGDGKIGNPFYSVYQDSMRVYLGTNVLLDKLYLAATGKAEPEKAARSKQQPLFTNF